MIPLASHRQVCLGMTIQILPTLNRSTPFSDQGNRTTPSYVAFTNEERLIGDAAKNQAAMNPKVRPVLPANL